MSLILCACNCGETLEERDTKGRLRSFIWGHQNRGRSISLPSIRGENHYNWKGGRTVNDAGYILIRMPAHHRANKYGYVREHIVVYENYHKCCILPWIDVHHLDKDKKNNKPENLILVTKSEHNKAHAKERSELEYIIQNLKNGIRRSLRNNQICSRCDSYGLWSNVVHKQGLDKRRLPWKQIYQCTFCGETFRVVIN